MKKAPQLLTLNLGSGQGASVLDVVLAFEKASCRSIPHEGVPLRDGDATITVADPSAAAEQLNWRTKPTLQDMCLDGWEWRSTQPKGCQENN